MALPIIAGIFNVLVGLMLVSALVLMGAAIVLYFTRLGTWPTYRDEAIRIMMWAVAILFVLIVLLAVVKFIQTHPAAIMAFLGLLMVVVFVAVGIKVLTAESEPEKDR